VLRVEPECIAYTVDKQVAAVFDSFLPILVNTVCRLSVASSCFATERIQDDGSFTGLPSQRVPVCSGWVLYLYFGGLSCHFQRLKENPSPRKYDEYQVESG
jgi:hypothetical protein